MNRSLKALLQAALPAERARFATLLDVAFVDLAHDSRMVRQGDIFINTAPHVRDGARFAHAAITRGAVAVLSAYPLPASLHRAGLPIVVIERLPDVWPHLMVRAYGTGRLHAIGITGTNGKTSTCHFAAQMLSRLEGRNIGVLGTIGNGYYRGGKIAHLTPSTMTTLGCGELHKTLAELSIQADTDTFCMEVSSHGLAQRRTAGIAFDTAVFTNIGHDHLDYHATMAAYKAAKQTLFTDYPIRHKVLNWDDPFGRELAHMAKEKRDGTRDDEEPHTWLYAIGQSPPEDAAAGRALWATDVMITSTGLAATVHYQNEALPLTLGLIGDFHLYNALAAMGVLLARGFPFAEVVRVANRLTPIRGRMEMVCAPTTDPTNGKDPTAPNAPTVIVDYAHTPDALAAALKAARHHVADGHRLWCVFGCGGNRDMEKRPAMGEVAARLADAVIITDDNPRQEPAANIRRHILQGIGNGTAEVAEIPDRQKAIRYAVQKAQAGDLILLAGKGHETTQTIGATTHYANDAATASAALYAR